MATAPWKSLWEVLSLFLIPIGGGIPAGVLLAKTRGFGWPVMTILYFISDVILACVFEPLMLLLIRAGRNSPKFAKVSAIAKKTVEKTTSYYGTKLGPMALILVAFGADPMTGRAATAAAGHGFITGWILSITGDMLYFTLIMVSTLWLSNILGDGTWTTIIILVVMMVAPGLIRKLRGKRALSYPVMDHQGSKGSAD
jgi:uncharacterized membrane protein